MKILHISETMKGGVGTFLNEMIPLQQARYGEAQVSLIAPREDVSQVPHIPSKSLYCFSRPSRFRGLLPLVLQIIKQLIKQKPDVIHVHSTFAGLFARLLALFSPARVIYTPHCWAMNRYHSKMASKSIAMIEWALSFVTNKIIAVCEDERQQAIQIGIRPEKIITVPNGLSEEIPDVPARQWEDSRLKLLFVGRLDLQKGIDVLIKALDGMEDKVTLSILGKEIVDCFHFPFEEYPHIMPYGWLPFEEVFAFMKASDAIVMPSRWEGLPYVALEAMRLGKPIIATRVGGLPEAVIDGHTGILFRSGDAVRLREILENLDKAELQRLGAGGKAYFEEHFTSANAHEKICAIYEEA